MKYIAVYVPQSAVIEAISPAYRLFKTANEFLLASGREALFVVEFVGLSKMIKAQDGEYTVQVDKLLHEVKKADLVIIPALYGDMENAIAQNEAAISWLQQRYEQGSEVASLCVGAFLLAATGLLDGKKCSTHWAYYQEFREKFKAVEVVDGSIITDEGRIYSSGGANSLWNLLLYLLEKYTSRDIAILAAKYFAIDIDRDNQGAFTIFKGQRDHLDEEIQQMQGYIERHYMEKITIEDLADKVAMNRRTFERRFKNATNNTVIEYTQRVRIEAAKRSFEASRKNVNEVMYDVGYTDTKSFRDVFKKITGLTPIEYRNKYSKYAAAVG
ncbi:MAG TPA: helix-turn-helix domain-containing protein [Saprospiraceae bacterium]|nr:helix-turn-helix domain-containing protein [Saprospiraceae bacterium]HMQ84433.1 helix-turn-helix domain-containing protein [Saprospiraceae bacterium]